MVYQSTGLFSMAVEGGGGSSKVVLVMEAKDSPRRGGIAVAVMRTYTFRGNVEICATIVLFGVTPWNITAVNHFWYLPF